MPNRTSAQRVSVFCASLLSITLAAQTPPHPGPFTLQQLLSAPYATELTAAPTGNRFAWDEAAEGRHNLWIGAPNEPARQLTHFPDDDGLDIAHIVWSPDGTTLAFARGTEDGPDGRPANPAHLQPPPVWQIWTVPASGATQPVLLGEGRSPLFTRDGRSLLFLRNGQIWIAPLNTNPPAGHQLVFDRGEASDLTLSPDGNLLAFISTRGHGQREHSFVALFDLRTHTLTFPASGTDRDSAPAFSPDGHSLAWLRSPFVTAPEFAPDRTSATPWSIQLLDLRTNEAHTLFTPTAGQPGSVLPHLSTGEPHLLWTSTGNLLFFSEADSWVHLYALDPAHANQPPKPLTPGSFEVEDATLSPDRTTLLYASNQFTTDAADVDRRHLWRLDLTHPGAQPTELTHGLGIETHPQLAADNHTLAALASDARSPMHPALISPTGELQPLHANAQPSTYPFAQLVAPQQVLFPSEDKLFTLHGQLFLPAHLDPNRKHAAILFFHGGPHRQMLLGYPGMDYYSNAYAMNQYLASRGFIVLSVNYRCGIGYGLDFRQCVHAGADGAMEYNDVLGAVHFLRSRSDVDPTRIGVWGGSYGGYLTALALARNSDLFAAGVDYHGVHEWIREDNASADWLRGTLPEQERIAAVAHQSSPMADVDRWRSPVLLIHGDDDPDVAYAQTPTLADALRARRVPVEELIFPDEVHGFLLHKDWLTSYERAADFFIRTLRPEQ
jgi:dipeptidyl aminopeptidase/acylaminoacyl peptidase